MNTYRSVTVYAVWARTHLFPKMINVLASTGYITVFEDEVRVINERIRGDRLSYVVTSKPLLCKNGSHGRSCRRVRCVLCVQQ